MIGHRLIHLIFTDDRTGGQRLFQLVIAFRTLRLLHNGHFIEDLRSGFKISIPRCIRQGSSIGAAQQNRIYFSSIQGIRHFCGQSEFNSGQCIAHQILQFRNRPASLLGTNVFQGCKGIVCSILNIQRRIICPHIDRHQSCNFSLTGHIIHSLAELGSHTGNTGAAQNNQRHQNQRRHLAASLALLFLLEQKNTGQYPNQRKQRSQNHNIQGGQQIQLQDHAKGQRFHQKLRHPNDDQQYR